MVSNGSQFALWRQRIISLVCCLMLAACASKSGGGSNSGSTWTVKRGDTLYRISRETGTPVADLARLNGLKHPYTITVGQKLRVNGATASASKRSRPPAASGQRTTGVARMPSKPAAGWPPIGERCWRWPASGKVVLPYSSADGGNKGIDIAGTRGDPIYAAGAGTVVYTGNQLRGYGNLIMIKHDQQYITAYAHNDTMLVRNGEKVAAGQKIATMGNSGAESVRLHFQVRYKATAIDPQRYLPLPGKSPSC
ncbi:peptidoglycan DD-metalloendopeptidase family protein [Shimwellia pseudoproteus]|uniref:amidase activator ActS n=1 Tax=Shimwellia pseudoproteus TaxID=570012 RepID=UPI0018EBAC4F|nr:amidase activator ActS [Shimwellia pseudoproteus]MBJ3815899.1 peptidoglycan DD-metalloendopeptidase family protein [Shimwellia pseudoproteus]